MKTPRDFPWWALLPPALALVVALSGWGSYAPSTPPAPARESCLECHDGMTGFSAAHRPDAIGCAACHGGDVEATDSRGAHAGLVRVPGNLADASRTCGTAGCHADVVPRIERSIMTTFAGAITTDRCAFGEAVDPAAAPPHVADLGRSPADLHFRQLCAACHLGQPKTEFGPVGENSRGGGCNACHLVYSPEASAGLARYQKTPADGARSPPRIHPAITLEVGNGHCFGCHSRSSRISTNYEGWHESNPVAKPVEGAVMRRLEDGRVFERRPADVHHERGLDCIDCHTAGEVMGKGATVAHKGEQVAIRCEDCHARTPATVSTTALDPESALLVGLRGLPPSPERRLGRTADGGTLYNVSFDAKTGGAGELRRKRTGEILPLKAPAEACAGSAGHARLSCASCHTAWAPRCVSCHTRYDASAENFDHLARSAGAGAWIEEAGTFAAVPPTLGIVRETGQPGAEPEREVVDTFVPGMILELDRSTDPSRAPDPIFRRFYARIAAHTVRREARSCESCHNDPVALGYGEGELRYRISGDEGRWIFRPAHPLRPEDGLPDDAWIGFLQPARGVVAARPNLRPFTVDEQKRILEVGACLTCHAADSPVMRAAPDDFKTVRARHDRRCVFPVWP